MHQVKESDNAKIALYKIQPEWAARIRQKISHIAADPYGRHNNVTKLQNSEYYRLRVGDWRIIYSINNNELLIFVIDVLSRGSAYKH